MSDAASPCAPHLGAPRLERPLAETNCPAHYCPACHAWYRLGPDRPQPRERHA